MLYRTRAGAIASGASRYMTGEACKHGHVAERRTHNAQCVACAARRQEDRCASEYVREGRRASDRARYRLKREEILAKQAERRKTPQALEKRRNRLARRYATDALYRVERVLRSRMQRVLRGAKKCAGVDELLGCTRDFFMVVIATKLQPGMSWENYGDWHIDHIRPCASFDLTKEDQQRECFHFSNLQPLWAFENLSKGCRVIPV